MKKKTVKFVSAVVALGVVSGAYVGVNSYVSSQEKKESEEEDTSVSFSVADSRLAKTMETGAAFLLRAVGKLLA